MIKVLIVDDEVPSQKEISYMVGKSPGFFVIGTAGSGREALSLVDKLKPEVVFLDIQLYDINGIELAETINGMHPDVIIIFATAYDDYALKAFDLNAFDYVVKPFDEVRVAKTLERVRKCLAGRAESSQMVLDGDKPLSRICAGANERWEVIDCQDIIYVTVEGKKTFIKLDSNTLSVPYTLQEMYEKLDHRDFLRVHRAYVVNLRHVKEVIPWFNGSLNLILNDRGKSEIPCSRHYARDLKRRVGLITQNT